MSDAGVDYHMPDLRQSFRFYCGCRELCATVVVNGGGLDAARQHVMTAGSSPRCPKCDELPTRYDGEPGVVGCVHGLHQRHCHICRIERLERDLATARVAAMVDRAVASMAIEPKRRAMTLTGEVPA